MEFFFIWLVGSLVFYLLVCLFFQPEGKTQAPTVDFSERHEGGWGKGRENITKRYPLSITMANFIGGNL